MQRHTLQLINNSCDLERVTIIVGNFGSGKTEVSVNLALRMARDGISPLSIIDLDIANLYFRCREAVDVLDAAGIESTFPKGELTWADLPIILPTVGGAIEDPAKNVIIDVGGDNMGARVLASLADFIHPKECRTYFVHNYNRPFTQDVSGSLKKIAEVSAAGKIAIDGLIVNPHLTGETTPEVVMEGLHLSEDISRESGIPIKFVAVMKDVLEKMDAAQIPYPVFEMNRIMLPPWMK